MQTSAQKYAEIVKHLNYFSSEQNLNWTGVSPGNVDTKIGDKSSGNIQLGT